MPKVALLIFATNGYATKMLRPLLDSVDEYFLPGIEVEYFLFTNIDQHIALKRPLTRIFIEHKRFPGIVLQRPQMIVDHYSLYDYCSHIFCIDTDAVAVGEIGPDILIDGIVAVLHPGYEGGTGDPDRNPNSTAYIPHTVEDNRYYYGGFTGGKAKYYINMMRQIARDIAFDTYNGVTAKWYDESHYNRYLYDVPPDLTLPPIYACPEGEEGAIITMIKKDHSIYHKS